MPLNFCTGRYRLTFVDGDTVEPSNLNRQITTLHSTIGKYKTTVLPKAEEINPEVKVTSINSFLQYG